MVLLDGLPQASATYVRIDLRRGKVRVPQHALDRAQVRTPLQEIGCEGVTQDMRSHSVLGNSSETCNATQSVEKILSRHRPAKT